MCAAFAVAALGCQTEPADSQADAPANAAGSTPAAETVPGAGAVSSSSASVPDTAAAPATASSSALGDLPVSQIVRFRPGPMLWIHLAKGLGTLHIDPDCIVLEVWGANGSIQRYTVLFGDYQQVTLASPTGQLVLHYPIRSPDLPDGPALVRFAHRATIHEGHGVAFAAPNRWRYEHMNPDTGALVTKPHPSCPQVFWFPNTLWQVDIERTRDLPIAPRT